MCSGKNTLDNVYSNIKHGYKVSPLPHLGKSNHISLFLTPAYRLIVSTVKPNVRHIQVWPDGACEQLRDCFNTTEWSLLQDNDINTYTSTVLFYIKCCVDKKKKLLNKLNLAFRSGDKVSVQRDQVEAEEGHQGSLQAED